MPRWPPVTVATVWSLEQDRSWYEYMGRVLKALHLDNVRLWYTPLRSYGEFAWFDLGTMVLPRHFPIVSCDGPACFTGSFPRTSTRRGGSAR